MISLKTLYKNAASENGVLLMSVFDEYKIINLNTMAGNMRAHSLINDFPDKVVGVYKVTKDVTLDMIKEYIAYDTDRGL
jgi:hypothetical protein